MAIVVQRFPGINSFYTIYNRWEDRIKLPIHAGDPSNGCRIPAHLRAALLAHSSTGNSSTFLSAVPSSLLVHCHFVQSWHRSNGGSAHQISRHSLPSCRAWTTPFTTVPRYPEVRCSVVFDAQDSVCVSKEGRGNWSYPLGYILRHTAIASHFKLIFFLSTYSA